MLKIMCFGAQTVLQESGAHFSATGNATQRKTNFVRRVVNSDKKCHMLRTAIPEKNDNRILLNLFRPNFFYSSATSARL